jgi:hypothetical protein
VIFDLFAPSWLSKRLQIRENVVHVRIGVFSQLLDVRLQRIVHREPNQLRGPRPVPA